MQKRVVPREGNGCFLWWRNQLKMAFQCNYARFIQIWHSFGSTALHNLFCPILIHRIIKLHHLDPQMGLHIPLFIATAHLQREVLRFFVQKAFEPLRHGSLSLWLHHWVGVCWRSPIFIHLYWPIDVVYNWGVPSSECPSVTRRAISSNSGATPTVPSGNQGLSEPALFGATPSWWYTFPPTPWLHLGPKPSTDDPAGKTGYSRMPPFVCLRILRDTHNSITGWWFQPTPLKNIKVSWDDDIPNIWKVIIQSCSKPPSRLWFVIIFPFEIAITYLTWPGKVSSFRYQAWKKCMAPRISFSCSLENCWHSQHPIRTARGNPSPTSTKAKKSDSFSKFEMYNDVQKKYLKIRY